MALNFPLNPSVGQIYTVNNSSWQWNGTYWVAISNQDAAAPVYIGNLPPSSPIPGDLWWNSDNGQLFIRYEDEDTSQWVSATVPPPVADLDSDAVIDAILSELTEYANIAAAIAGGVPTGGLFKVPGSGASAIRVVVP